MTHLMHDAIDRELDSLRTQVASAQAMVDADTSPQQHVTKAVADCFIRIHREHAAKLELIRSRIAPAQFASNTARRDRV